jgi:hypothetical protein
VSASGRVNGEHVGPVARDTVSDAGDAEDEPDEVAGGIEGAGEQAANAVAEPEDAAGTSSLKPWPQMTFWNSTARFISA